jgi:hypothetical protein
MPHQIGFIHHFHHSQIDAICSKCNSVVGSGATVTQLIPAQLGHRCGCQVRNEVATSAQVVMGDFPK